MKEKLLNKHKAVGIMLSEIAFPNISYLLKNNGYDFFIIDCEHGSFNFETAAAIIGTAKLCGICPIVRIPEIRREVILKYLDAGAGGLVVPMVKNAEDVKKVVEYARYAPLGQRGISTMRAHTGYNSSNLLEYMKNSNQNNLIFIQIELNEALNNIEEIAGVEGIDGLIVGPSDLSMDLGIFNQLEHPLMLHAIEKVILTAQNKGLYSGIITSNIELINSCIEKGINVLSCDSELGLINKGLKTNITKLTST